jgi:Family of unknown function (DUF6209)
MSRVALCVVIVGLSGGCTTAPDSTQTAPQPLTAAADSADHACTVVLRELEPAMQPRTWAGSIEIATTAGALVPSALYQNGSDPAWYVATATPSTLTATPGYTRFDLEIDAAGSGTVQVVPYAVLAQGGRLFDHNRNQDDTANYVLGAPDFTVWPDPTVCEPIGGPTHANLVFDADFTQHRDGLLEPGGDMSIVYDTSRLAQCEEEQGGYQQWDVTARARFAPGNEEQDTSVRDAPATIAVPSDAQSVAVWFEATNVDGCHQWDSNLGANYTFQMMRAPEWVGDATDLFTRDDSQDLCNGGADAATGFSYDTWVRSQAVVTNLCFQVYQPGITDTQDPDLWQDLDVELQLQVSPTTWQSIPIDFDQYVGNNARYKISWRDLDPLRDYNCPQVPVTPTSDGMYVQAQLGYYVTVNGYQLRPEPGAWFEGTFVDYPNNAWRAANCP